LLQGSAGGVGESSGIDRLTDVPECREEEEFCELRLYGVLGSSRRA
jgi:hypothetical protein